MDIFVPRQLWVSRELHAKKATYMSEVMKTPLLLSLVSGFGHVQLAAYL